MDDMNKTIPPKRTPVPEVDDRTMPGKRDRKPDGRFAVGDLIMSRYKVLAELGQGGMGVVYKCFDETAGIEVALKALPPELSHNTIEMEDIKENFQLVHKLHHPNIAAYNNLERDKNNGNYYLIMECCEGEDLRRWIRRKRREQGQCNILPIIQQIAEALDYAHEMKIIHRDIKPGNIMIDQTGKIKVLDFGLAAQIHTSMTRVSMAYHGTSGTGPYMAPEQWRGKRQDASADQYALAVMVYEMLAGNLPFESPDPAVLKQAVLDEIPDPIDGIPEFAQDAIFRAMSKNPVERFASCADFVAALERNEIPNQHVPQTTTAKKQNIHPLLRRAQLFVIAGDYDAALPFCDKLLDEDPENGWAYFYKLMAQSRLPDDDSLSQLSDLENNPLFRLAMLCADRDLKARLDAIIDVIRQREAEEKRKAEEDAKLKAEEDAKRKAEAEAEAKRKTEEDAKRKAEEAEAKRKAEEELKKFTEIDCNGIKLEMVKVEPGTFTMSRNDGEIYVAEVAHEKTLNYAYYIGKYEVTQAQWQAVMGDNPSYFKGDNRPVENVSWHEAMAFCEKMNQYAPNGWRFTLPTETQWEFAARGGNRSNGYKYSGSDSLNDVGWYDDNSGGTTHKVGSKSPNELGLYDMSGNVWEWCLDNWESKSNNTRAEFSRSYRDSDGSYRVSRGGGWGSSARYCRSAIRDSNSPGCRNCDLGFRLALVSVQ